MVIQSITPQCRTEARNFFGCIEDKLKLIGDKGLDISQMEREFNDVISPACMKDYNLEDCLRQHGPGL
jgi:hypothetical protein